MIRLPFKTPVRLEPHGSDAAGPIQALVAADCELITVLHDATAQEATAITQAINASARVPSLLWLLQQIKDVINMTNPEHPDYADSCADTVQALCELEKRIDAELAQPAGQ
jgi:hypothetical protein